MITDASIACNRPDIVVFPKQERCTLMLEVSFPADINIAVKEEEKVRKYQALASDLSYCYEQSVDVIPIVFGHSGVISSCQ